MTNSIIHQPTEFSCMACVAAMITGDPLQMVFDVLGHDGSKRVFRFLEIAGYLNSRGYHLGAYGDFYGRARVEFSHPALLIVASTSGKGTHAVFWPGDAFGKILDPEPANAGKRLTAYRVLEWWPVTRFED
ncbi:hypothetical protein F6V25_07905 [Oryzomonas japonica]|uniref:Uncharacterized protein n=1 Tax=Oryzomonas japonica TaxID=2603858 RepID=A0A7J4ZRR1_9BACT|nr:hypothetical protein [Oryzomonas japonica]KAB0665637.1 hypothetical protein F6V25_07905 [Oryzomonas japonica]